MKKGQTYLSIPKCPVVEETRDAVHSIFVVGDIHGCLSEFLELTDLLADQEVEVVFCGDLLDHGPHGATTVSCLRTMSLLGNLRGVMGNHDEKHVRYRKHIIKQRSNPSYIIPMECPGGDEQEHRAMTDDDIEWLSRLPTAIKYRGVNNTYIVTHAGLIEGEGLYQPTGRLLRNRYIKKQDGKYCNVKWSGNTPPPGGLLWKNAWTGPEIVIHGHIVYDLKEPVNEPLAIGLDTGACFGGYLTGVKIDLSTDQRTFYQVKAGQE